MSNVYACIHKYTKLDGSVSILPLKAFRNLMVGYDAIHCQQQDLQKEGMTD